MTRNKPGLLSLLGSKANQTTEQYNTVRITEKVRKACTPIRDPSVLHPAYSSHHRNPGVVSENKEQKPIRNTSKEGIGGVSSPVSHSSFQQDQKNPNNRNPNNRKDNKNPFKVSDRNNRWTPDRVILSERNPNDLGSNLYPLQLYHDIRPARKPNLQIPACLLIRSTSLERKEIRPIRQVIDTRYDPKQVIQQVRKGDNPLQKQIPSDTISILHGERRAYFDLERIKSKFVNLLMYDGEKSKGKKLFQGACPSEKVTPRNPSALSSNNPGHEPKIPHKLKRDTIGRAREGIIPSKPNKGIIPRRDNKPRKNSGFVWLLDNPNRKEIRDPKRHGNQEIRDPNRKEIRDQRSQEIREASHYTLKKSRQSPSLRSIRKGIKNGDQVLEKERKSNKPNKSVALNGKRRRSVNRGTLIPYIPYRDLICFYGKRKGLFLNRSGKVNRTIKRVNPITSSLSLPWKGSVCPVGLVPLQTKQTKQTKHHSVSIKDSIDNKVSGLSYTRSYKSNILYQAIENVKPILELRRVRKGGTTFTVPAIVNEKRQERRAIKWLIESASLSFRSKKNDFLFSDCLKNEIIQAFHRTGKVRQRRDEQLKIAQYNRAYTRYRWW